MLWRDAQAMRRCSSLLNIMLFRMLRTEFGNVSASEGTDHRLCQPASRTMRQRSDFDFSHFTAEA